jgi:hypothetical protein
LGVTDNKELRRIFGLKRKEDAEAGEDCIGEEPHNLYASRNITEVIKSGRMRWAVHVVFMGGWCRF